MIELVAGPWRSGPVRVAVGFRARLAGLAPAAGHGMVIPGASVHGLWMRHPLTVAAVAGDGRVLAVGRLTPGRVWSARGAAAIVELPPDVEPPPVGAVLTGRPIP